MRLLLVGNYGDGNVGDEALREYFLGRFTSHRWTVLSAHPSTPQELPRLPSGIRSFFSFKWLRTLNQLPDFDAVVFGGGSLFTDIESPWACILWWLHVRAARFFGKPVLLAFQGVGPFRTKVGKWCARSALKSSSFISVRDAESLERAALLTNTKIIQSFDPVFSSFLRANIQSSPKNVFMVIPRKNPPLSLLKDACDILAQHSFDETVILSMQADDAEEKKVCQDLYKALPGNVVTRSVTDPRALQREVASAAFVLSARYHGALAALAVGTPMQISYQGKGDKLATLAQILRRESDPQARIATLLDDIKTGEEALQKALQMIESR